MSDDVRGLLDDFVAERGGVLAFSRAQVEIARTAVQLMLQLRTAAPSEVVKLGDVLARLTAQLPPIIVTKTEIRHIPKGISLQELTNAYCELVQNEGNIDWDFEGGKEEWLAAQKAKKGTDSVGPAEAAAAPARPPPPEPAPDPMVEAEPEILPAHHNAGSLITRKPPTPPARAAAMAPDPRYGGRHDSPYAARDAVLFRQAVGFRQPAGSSASDFSAAMENRFVQPSPRPGRWVGR
jgi:hypothetical protein